MKRKARRSAALVAALTGIVWSLALLGNAQVAAGSRRGAINFPNVKLTTQDGEEVGFYDLIKGRIVAIDLIYTTCQYACPLESARLARMQQLLGDRMGRDVFFISISIDPEHDTPAVLKGYAEKYQAGPGWIFLTGNKADIDMLSKKLGLWSDPTLTQDGHTPMLLIGNEATGQWTRTSALDNPKFTAQIIGEWMNSYKTATVGRSYAEAAPISKPAGTGEYQFRSLCSNCHTIGGGDKIGPDLAVALDTRERAWLIEYTVQPDIVRARNDATARMLAAKYPSVRMPNLYLTVAEVQSIFRFVETQKSRVASADAAPGPAAPRAAATTGSSPLVDAAVAIQVALAHDTMIGVAAQAATLRQAAAAFGEAGTAIETAATDLARQTTITDARRAFGTVSDALVASVRAGNVALGGGVRIAYCPMVRRSWLQKEGPVANPYFGSRMLNCGELTN